MTVSSTSVLRPNNFERGHRFAFDAAWVDIFEVLEVGVRVEGEAMHGNLTSDVQADGTNLLFAHPDIGVL